MYAGTLISISSEERARLLGNIGTSIDNEIRHRMLAAINVAIDHEILHLANRWNNAEEGTHRFMLDVDMRARLNQPILLINEYEAIAFYFRNSENVYNFGGGAVLGRNDAENARWFEQALDNPGRMVISSEIRGGGGRSAVSFAIHPGAIIFNNNIEVIYFRFAVDFLRGYNLNQGETIITDREGWIIYSTGGFAPGSHLSEFPQIEASSAYITNLAAIDGEQVLITTAVIGTPNWKIIHIDSYNQITDLVSSITIYGYIAGSLYLLFFLLFSLLFYRKIVRPAIMLEVKAMQYQITPHFIINTMNSIKIMAMISRQNNIEKMTESFMRLLSAVLGKSGTESSVAEEIENIKHYIHIMKVRFGEKFGVEYGIDHEILNFTILSFLLQPIVENCILHGFNEKDFGCMIKIKGYCKKDKLFFEVWDNGQGMLETKAQKVLAQNQKNGKGFLSMGVYNVNRRIKLNYGRAYGLHVESVQGEFTQVTFELPMIKNKAVSK